MTDAASFAERMDFRTLDAFVINNKFQYERLIVDEGYMAQLGEVVLAALISGATEIMTSLVTPITLPRFQSFIRL